MAKLFPNTKLPDDIELKPERDVAQLLCEQLPATVRIYHSYPWLNKEEHTLREGEADFVILDPRYGILIVEVKGGHIEYDPIHDRWHRKNGSHEPKDPYQQSSKSHRYFERIIKARQFLNDRRLPFLRGRMVVFPDTVYSGSFPKGGCKEITLDARHINEFNKHIQAIFEAQPSAHFYKKDGIGTECTNKIHQALFPTFDLTPALFRQVEHQEKGLIRLTNEQRNLVDTLAEGTDYRAHIQGVAGSGKTVLALHLAYQFANKHPDKKLLFICYNEQLADWISQGIPPKYEGRILVTYFHKLCSDWVRKAKLQWLKVGVNDDEFWANHAPNLLCDAIDTLPEEEKFDAIIADEGQDFRTQWWDALELIGNDPDQQPFLVFYDENQKIFDVGDKASWPRASGNFRLEWNCRNTNTIANYSADFIQKKIPAKLGSPDGDPPEFKYAGTDIEAKREVFATLRNWLNTGKLKPEQIAIVSSVSISNSCISNETHVGNISITKNLADWRKGKGILLTSVWKFKGLEADAMILCDVEGITHHFNEKLAYVACSRAKHLLTVISTKPSW